MLLTENTMLKLLHLWWDCSCLNSLYYLDNELYAESSWPPRKQLLLGLCIVYLTAKPTAMTSIVQLMTVVSKNCRFVPIPSWPFFWGVIVPRFHLFCTKPTCPWNQQEHVGVFRFLGDAFFMAETALGSINSAEVGCWNVASFRALWWFQVGT